MDKIVFNLNYNEIINLLVKEKGLKISEDNFYLKSIFENEFRKSNFTEDELIVILKNNKEQLVKFVLLEDSESKNDDLMGEYRPGEEQDGDIDDEGGYSNEVSKYFLISSLIKFAYLKHNNLKGLEDFFNKIRIPGARKYINELNEMYNKTING